LTIREEDVLRNYPLTYRDLTQAMKRRYSDFSENQRYHDQRKKFEAEKKYCIVRLLNPASPRSSKTRFYNPNIFQAFDKIYELRKKASAQ
jgi:hypothetical protein